MVVCATTDQVIAQTTALLGVAEALSKRLSILEDLLLVLLELLALRLLERYSESCDGVVVGASLVTREDGGVDGTLQVVHLLVALLIDTSYTLTEEDHGTSGSAQGLVGRCCDNVRVRERRGNDTSSDEA